MIENEIDKVAAYINNLKSQLFIAVETLKIQKEWHSTRWPPNMSDMVENALDMIKSMDKE